MAQRGDTLENRRLGAHCAILQANDTGAPLGGQKLKDPQPGTSNAEASSTPKASKKRVSEIFSNLG